ncbi:ParB/Srx family N-terminal domain-containing protein [Yersinia rochesterensis]|uniref:ParB/Srx family N-terminal domain-containing protein n=1 Tax=Yersinia rochesterensis TaxID=1604335 RepID=UPI0011A4E138|nr:ParB/Srx family N-terminal domain-containing protein [Yersinia rochesterensis]
MYLNKIDLCPTGPMQARLAGGGLSAFILLLSGLMLYSVNLHAAQFLSQNDLQAKSGDIIQIKLSELHPTQIAVGKLQIAGDLADYAHDSKRLFNELCKVQGAGKLAEMNASSTPKDPYSYRCKLAIGTKKADMNTVDIGPAGKLYLTDGHHAFNSFWDVPGGGGDVTLSVLVGQNVSRDSNGKALTQAQFEQKMTELKHFLPIDAEGKPITFSQLPNTLGMSGFQDDPYRSMLYYLRGISYDKSDKNLNPETGKPYPAVPFLEFYWGQLLQNKMDLKHYNLHKQDDYIKALKDAAVLMVNVPKQQLIGHSGQTAAALGQMSNIDEKRLNKLAKPDSKLAKALEYQASH